MQWLSGWWPCCLMKAALAVVAVNLKSRTQEGEKEKVEMAVSGTRKRAWSWHGAFRSKCPGEGSIPGGSLLSWGHYISMMSWGCFLLCRSWRLSCGHKLLFWRPWTQTFSNARKNLRDRQVLVRLRTGLERNLENCCSAQELCPKGSGEDSYSNLSSRKLLRQI